MNVSRISESDEMIVHLNDDHLKIDTTKGEELVDIFLPVLIDSGMVKAPQVDLKTQILTLTMPLKPQSWLIALVFATVF